MGVLAQVGLLLWKNAKLSIRNPLLTVTTLLWPVIIFVIVAIVRTRLPPVPNSECHFKPQALPSVGTVDFMQSMMCDIETECLRADRVPKSNEPPTYGASIGALLDDLEPLFSNESSIVDDLESLSDTLEPLINLTKTLEDTFNMISEQNFYIGDFFVNQTKMRETLLASFDGEEADLIEALLGARINVLELLDVIGYSDSDSLICNATALQTYVIFPPNTNVENIASALCQLKRQDVENIINIILDELDVEYIADEVTSFLRALDRYGLDNFTRDVLEIQEQLENITALSDFVDVLPQLLQLTRLIPDIQRFIDVIQGGSVDQTLYVLERIIASIDWEGSPPWWSDVQQILFRVTDMIAAIFDVVLDVTSGDVTLEDLLGRGKLFDNVLKNFNVSRDSLAGFLNSTIPVDGIADLFLLLSDPDATVDAYCRGEIQLDEFLTYEVAVNETTLRNTLCKFRNGTSFLQALLDQYTAGKSALEILESLSGQFQPTLPGLDLGTLLNQTRDIFQDLDQLPDFIKDLPSLLTNPQIAQLLDLFTFNETSIQEFLITMLVEGASVVEGMFTQESFWPQIQTQLATQIIILDAEIAVIQRVMDGALIEAFKDDPFTQVGELFLEFGPNITEAILSTFLDPAKIEELMSLSPAEQQLVLCSDFIEYPPGLDVTYAQQELCKLNITELYPSHVEVWASYFPEVAQAIEITHLLFTGNVSLIPPEILANATFKNVILKNLELQEVLTVALGSEISLDEFFAGLAENINVTGTPDEWNAMLNRLTTKSLPALQESILIGEWESVLDYIGDIPEVHAYIAAEAMQDIIIQDLNIVLSIFNSLSRGEVPAYGGETEKLLHGIVFMTQQGNAIQAAILEAYQDPVKALVLGSTTDITQVLCNATLRDSLLDLTRVNISVLDSSLCSVDYVLLYEETIRLMQFERLSYLFGCVLNGSCDQPIDLNLTAVAVHTNELVMTIGELDESWQNWIELVVNGSDWLSLAPHFTPTAWMDALNTMLYMASFDNLTAVFQEIDPRNLTILIEDLVVMNVPYGELYLHQVAGLNYAVIQSVQAANNAFRLLQGVSEGTIIPEFQGTEMAKVIEAVLEVDLVQLNIVLSDPDVIAVLSQVGYLPFFCNASIRDVRLDLPGKGIDTSLFDRTICIMDWERAAEEISVFLYVPQIEQYVREFQRITFPDQYMKPSDIDWDTQAAIFELFIRNMANISGIMTGLGEQLEIEELLAYNNQQLLTGLIGVYPTNDTDWLEILIVQLSMVWQQLDTSLADLPGWELYKTNVYLVLSAIEQITSMNTTTGFPPFTLASILPNVTEFVSILRQIPNFTDDIIYQLLYAPIDPVKLIELASSNRWNETLCSAELLSGIFIEPAGLNLTQLQGTLCSIDFEALIGQLSQGTGIEHLISMIIDQIVSFSGGDDFGIGDYDPAQWASQIEQLIASFDVQNIQGFIQSLANEFMVIYEDIDAQLENVTGWIEFKSNLDILWTVLQYTTPLLGNGTNGDMPISLSLLVPNATELELLLAQQTPFSPEIIQALIYTPINPTALLELALSNNWNATLCTEEGLRMLFVLPEGLNLTELQGALCSADFQGTLMELMQDGAIENIISVIIDQLYLSIIPEFTLPGFDLSAITDLIPQIVAMLQQGNMQNIPQYFESLNSLTAMFANETWYQYTITQLQVVDFITKTFTDKIIMLEGQTIVFPNLSNLLANSSEFQRILLDDYQVGLGLVEAFMTLGLQPDKLISFFNMTNPLVTLCATGQFSSFFYSPLNPDFDIASLEEAVCEIDFEQLVMEFRDLVSFDDILQEIEQLTSGDQTGPYNWTAGYLTDERLSLAISQLVLNPPKVSFDEVWLNKTLTTLIGLADRLNRAQQSLTGAVPSDVASSLDSLAELLQQGLMANQSWAIEMASALRTINAALGYTNDKLWALPGRNITLQDLLPPDIATYIEANSDLTPDLIALLLQASVNTEALLAANGTWLEVVCSDAGNLPTMVQVPPDVDLDAAFQALCSLDLDQWAVAYMQEIQSILIEVESGKEVNFTSLTANFQKLALGIQTLVENPPTLLKYNEEWFQGIVQRTGAILAAMYNDTQFTNPNNLAMLFNEMWTQISLSDPSLLTQARINDYITQVLIDMLQRFPGQTYTLPRLDELFGDTTYVRQLLSHSDIAPEIIDAFMLLAVDQEKITYLISTPDAFVELCRTGQFSTFFQLPPDSPTNITLVENAVCTTNLTLVLAELDQKFMFTEIAMQLERITSNDPSLPPFNQTAASLHMMELSNLIATLIQTPPVITVDPVWWGNVYNRSQVIVLQWLQRLTDQAMNGSSVPGLETVIAQLQTLNIPGFNTDQLEMWLRQSQRIQILIAQAINGSTNVSLDYILQELLPEPNLIRELLNLTGLPQDITEVFLQMIPQLTKWLPMLSSPDPLTAVCEGGLFQEIFLLTNTSIDIQPIEDQICSLNLTNIDSLISQLFMSDLDALLLELLQPFFQVPGLDPQTFLNISREISAIITGLSTDPNYQLDLQSLLARLQTLDIPGFNTTQLETWLHQSQRIQILIAQAINGSTNVSLDYILQELLPDPNLIRELLNSTGLPEDVTEIFLQMIPQITKWLPMLSSPDPLTAVCEGGLFQEIFLLINTSIDIQPIEDQICSLNLTNIDSLISQLFMSDFDALLLELLQPFLQVPGLDPQTFVNVSREISAIITGLSTDPNYQLDPQSIIGILETLQVPGLNESWVQDWIRQYRLMQYINNVVIDWLMMNNGTEFAVPTFSELFPDPSIIEQLLTDLGFPVDITQAFLYSAIRADQWTQVWMSPDPLQAICNSSLLADTFTHTFDTSIDIGVIQDTLCSINLSSLDAILNDVFKTNRMIVQLSLLLFNTDPSADWQTAWNTSLRFSQMFDELFQNPPVETQDIQQFTVSLFNELENMLRMYGVWDDTEHYLKYVEFYLQVIGHHLNNSNNFLKDLFDPTVSLDKLMSYVGLTPEEVRTALLGDIGNIFRLADLYFMDGDWNYLFQCNGDKEQFEADNNLNNADFLNVTALREVFCSINITEFFETVKNVYGLDFQRLTELSYIRSTNSSSLDIESLVNLGTDIAQLITDLASLPSLLTKDLDLDFFVMRLTNLSNALTTQDYEQLLVLLDELAPLLRSPDVVYQIQASLMSATNLMSWWDSMGSTDSVVWLERIEGALNETLLWHTILPALNLVDLLIEADLDSLNPLGYKYFDLITNETVLQQYLIEIMGLAPEYAEAITLSGIKDMFMLANHHLSGTWESTYCIAVDPANSTDFNLTAVYSLLCNLDREQFFESLNALMGIDVLGLAQWIDDLQHIGGGLVKRFDWQTLVDNILSTIDMLSNLTSIGDMPGVNVTEVVDLVEKLQEGIQQFDYEVLIEQMEILNQILYLNGTWDNVKGYMNAITNIVEWLNLQLENAHANNVTLVELITHHATALQNLYSALGYDLFPQLVTALVDPQQAMTLHDHNDIEMVVCDADSFNDLVTPTIYKDTSSLQGSLCSHLMSGHPTIASDLMTHFNIAPLEHEVAVLATNNHGQGFKDQDVDMRHMINEFQKLSNGLIVITMSEMMSIVGVNTTMMLPKMDNTDDVITMISGALTSSLHTVPIGNKTLYDIIHPIWGRLDLAMIMVDDLFFTLPDREAEIQAVLDNDTIVNDAIPVLLIEVPNVVTAWNEVMQDPLQVPVLSKLLLELLKGSLDGASEDPSVIYEILTPSNNTSFTPSNYTSVMPGNHTSWEAMVDLFVSLERILATDFGQQLLDVFRIRENAERLDIITNPDSKDLPPLDASSIARTQDFIENAVYCSKYPADCIIDLHLPNTLDFLLRLAEVVDLLPSGSLESLEDIFNVFAPLLEEFLQQTANGTSELEQSLNTAFSFLRTVFEANRLDLNYVLSIFDFEEALLNTSGIYQFLRDNTELTEIDLLALRNGSINTTVLFELFDLGVEDSLNLLCEEALIDDLLVCVEPDIKEKIADGVCSNGTLIAVEFLRANLDLQIVIDLVTRSGGQTFPEFLLETLGAIGSLPDVDYDALGQFVAIVIPPLFENGFPSISDLDSLVENINITRRALMSVDALLTVFEDTFVEAFPNYKDFQRLVRTLLDNLYVLELLAEFPDLSVNNMLKNEVLLEDYLTEYTDLRRSEARDITYSTFNLEELFLTEFAEYIGSLCDPDFLSSILIFPNQTDPIIIADTMCGLSGDEIATLLETALPFIDVSAVVNVSYMADSFGGALSISNTTINKVMQSIASLESVSMALPALQQALSSFDDDPAVDRLREIAELGFFTGEEISAVTQEIVCGTTSLRKRRETSDAVRRYKRAPVSENSDEFCQDIFSSIVDGVDGRLVWAYLKPIIEGRILYSPDIPPVRRIIERANRTFDNIAQTQRFADVWLMSGGDLGTALDPDALDATRSLLENSYVQGLLEDQYGISSDQFTDVLNGNFTSVPPEQLQTLNLLAELVSNVTTCFNLNRFIGYADEASMVQAARSLDEENVMLAAVAFDIPADATELPAHIKYKIRMDTDNTPPTDRLRDRYLTRSSSDDFVFDLRYLRGYIMLQDMIEGSIVTLQASPDLQPPGVYLQMTPYPCFLNDEFTSIFTLVLPLVITISFVVLIGAMTHQLVYEKERGIEELMKVMGLPGGANWWAWFLSNSLILILISCVTVIILKFGNILPQSDWSLLLVLFLDYLFSIVMFCYLCSAVFQRASIASLASILVYLLFYLPYLAVFASESLLDTLWKPIVTSLFCPSTFSIGCVLLSQFETLGTGAQWDLVWHNPLEEDVTNMAFVLIALAVDGGIYLILGWYIKTLFPGKYGVPRSWYFPLQPSFWFHCSTSRKRDMTQYINSAFDPESGVAVTNQGSVVEEEPSNHPVGIAILNLTKIYRSCFKEEKVAVDNLTLNFFEGQVTALLGHNGAGKTTTINIITGLFPATSGKVYLQGVNVAKKVSATRENLGVCVQHNALYEDLTVREHMAMSGRVKGLRGKQLDDDIYTLLEDVGLLKKSEERVKNLSGGMKRKLSVAMAFVGHSSIVILDEPTSGVDPHARRAIWNLIMKHKTGRTIVLCTHFMDEADILGDRIAILDRGHLRCCGSPAFLKSRFSSGYHLSLTKESTSGTGTPTKHEEEDYKTKAVQNIYDTMKSRNSDVPSTSSGIATDAGSTCDASQVTDFIQARIPTAMLHDDIGTELVYILPVENGEREKFQGLFEDLDSSLGDLRIKSYGISDTTLKEVFLKVSTNRSVDGDAAVLSNANWSLRKPGETFSMASRISKDNSNHSNGHYESDFAVLLNAWGILIKRLHFVRRDWQGLIWTIIMPVVLVALAIGFSQLDQINREYQRQLTPAMFNPNSYVFYSDESESEMGQRLTDALLNPPGLGTTCMADADQMDLYPCVETNSHVVDQLADFNLASLAEVPENQCNCTDTGFGVECLPEAGGIPPPTWLTDTLVHLQNISMKEDKDRYLLDTQLMFRNSRFGGVSWFDVMGSNETQAKAWFNNRAYHAMPTFLNVMNNIILRATVSNNSQEYGITAYNHPLELSKQDLGVNIWLDAAKTFGIVIVLVTSLVLIPSAFSMFLVNENLNGSKRLHYISGVGTLTYWLTNLIWDMLSFCIPVGLMLVILYIFNFRGLILASNVGAFVALVFLYAFAIMCQIYICIPLFKEAGSAFIFLFCLLLLEAVLTNIPNWLVAVDAVSENESRVIEILNYVLLVFSPYCLSSGLLSLIQNQAQADIYRAFGVDEGIYEEPFQILKWHLVALAAEGAVAFVILLIVDAVRNSTCSSCLDPNVDDPPSYHENEDVTEEKQIVLEGGSDKDALVLKELRKVYRGPGGQKIVAVNDLCLAVSKGECFGLLGVNGAGKTSTFRMIVEDLSPTGGRIKKRAKSVGYCPQENAMYPQLSGEELLYCYARMKGINSSSISKAIAEICEELGMERYLRRRISTYSGGMKRCLAVAVALLGKPELILMDEPTTGMDPITKQRVLTSIVNVIRDNRSVILTSHSMEECEAVCTRLAIMVNGQFCCLGSPQHVKNRHGNGYSLVVRGQKTAKTDMTLITELVHRSFPGAELQEHHHNVVRFQLPPHNITAATIFGVMEREKTALNLEDYSVSQTSLDEVFVNFAKKQTDGLEDDTSSTMSAQEVSIINRAFEPDDDPDVDVYPRNTMSVATQL